MTFTSTTYANFIAAHSETQGRLFPQYRSSRSDFDIIIIGSGMGGGVLADDLADRFGKNKRILVIEAGSYLFPTHVYNVCRFDNGALARHFACDTFRQGGGANDEYYIHEKPQLNFGGRSIFWSGLIPTIQGWELDLFPGRVKTALQSGLLERAGATMNESVSMGAVAQTIVKKLRQSSLALHFDIQETPRALHQPYLTREGAPQQTSFVESTGVFNTAELLINQAELVSDANQGLGDGLQLLLNHYVEDLQNGPNDSFGILARDATNGAARWFQAQTVVLACGSIESPKLLRRSSLVHSLPESVRGLIGRGLTDHPTTSSIETLVTHIDGVRIGKDAHAKIIFYSKGLRDERGEILYPFNVEMNVNHEYWHLRDNDLASRGELFGRGDASVVDIKFSFGNCLDDSNAVHPAPPYGYVPDVTFKNLHWVSHLAGERLPALAGWHKTPEQIFAVLNDITYRIFSQFRCNGSEPRPRDEAWNGQKGKGFGRGTVHHAVGTLRMPYRPRFDAGFAPESVVDEDLRVIGTRHLYVCDMSVMPFSSAANPVRTLTALALRLAAHFDQR